MLFAKIEIEIKRFSESSKKVVDFQSNPLLKILYINKLTHTALHKST